MENLNIEGTRGIFFTPNVKLNFDTGVCEISGESYLEDTVSFYSQITNWIIKCIGEPKKKLTFNFKLTYFNTSSSRSIVEIMKELKTYKEKGGEIEINWYYPEDNHDILAEAEDIAEYLKIVINLIPYELNY